VDFCGGRVLLSVWVTGTSEAACAVKVPGGVKIMRVFGRRLIIAVAGSALAVARLSSWLGSAFFLSLASLVVKTSGTTLSAGTITAVPQAIKTVTRLLLPR